MTSAILTDAPEEPSRASHAANPSAPGSCETVAVLGAGTWGAVLAEVFARLPVAPVVRLWTPTGKHLAELRDARRHPHLPDLRLSPEILVTSNETDVLAGARIVVVAVASRYVREALKRTSPYVAPDALVVIASKGMEAATGKTLSEVVADVLPGRRIVVASGGSHAEEVVNNLPFGLTLAGEKDDCVRVELLFAATHGRFAHCTNVKGIEIAASLKNVVAVVAGIAAGVQLGDNFRACYLVDALAEIGRFAREISGAPLDPLQYGVFGDLLATALSSHSRNFRYGMLRGEGLSGKAALEAIDMVVEGIQSAQSLLTRSLEDFPVLKKSAEIVLDDELYDAYALARRLGY